MIFMATRVSTRLRAVVFVALDVEARRLCDEIHKAGCSVSPRNPRARGGDLLQNKEVNYDIFNNQKDSYCIMTYNDNIIILKSGLYKKGNISKT